MEHLSLPEVRERSEECARALEGLLATRALVGKPEARQWLFFRDCARLLLGEGDASRFAQISSTQAAQLKYEVEDALRRYYLRPGVCPPFVFSLVHRSALALYGLGGGAEYPDLAGYCLLVRDLGADGVAASPASRAEVATYLERVVTECVDAEFATYAALPEVKLDGLRRWFCETGPALKEIANVVTRHSRRGWVISNPLNPSTKRLLSLKVRKIDEDEATVATMEYWYLRWWSTVEDRYTYAYRETNRQSYVLRRNADGWCIFQNLRPPPRSSVPHRWKAGRGIRGAAAG